MKIGRRRFFSVMLGSAVAVVAAVYAPGLFESEVEGAYETFGFRWRNYTYTYEDGEEQQRKMEDALRKSHASMQHVPPCTTKGSRTRFWCEARIADNGEVDWVRVIEEKA